MQKNPSPQGYVLPSRVGEGPKIAMHAKTISVDMAIKQKFPGAGSYETHHLDNKNMKSGPKFSMGNEKRDAVDFHAKE